jgi:hypothetical protein
LCFPPWLFACKPIGDPVGLVLVQLDRSSTRTPASALDWRVAVKKLVSVVDAVRLARNGQIGDESRIHMTQVQLNFFSMSEAPWS